VGALGENQVHFAQCIQERKPSAITVVSCLPVELRGAMQRLWKLSRNFDRGSCGRATGFAFAEQHQTVLVIVLVRPPGDRQALVFILDVTPEDVLRGRSGSSSKCASGSR
jgi:hypothetical protein